MSQVLAVDDSTFAIAVEGADAGLVLVDFWAPWCGPCRFMSPVIEAIAAEFSGRVRVVKVNVDDSPQTSDRFAIRSIPTVALFRDGETVGSFSGFATLDSVRAFVAPQLTAPAVGA